jgi:methanogenic corrinoid protein MtbC1
MDTFAALAKAVVDLRREQVVRLCERIIAEGHSAERAISEGLVAGMKLVGEKFSSKEYFVPEVLAAGRALYAGMDVLGPHVERVADERGVAVLGVVEGDYHDIGKNIVKLMLSAAGVRVIDLGKSVRAEQFLTAVEDEEVDAVGISTLMTTTLRTMASHVDELRKRFSGAILVGGAPVQSSFAREIGANGTAPDAACAVELFLKEIDRVRA